MWRETVLSWEGVSRGRESYRFFARCTFHDYDFNYDLDHDLDFGCDCDFDLIGSIEWEGVWFSFGGSFSSEEPCSGREC